MKLCRRYQVVIIIGAALAAHWCLVAVGLALTTSEWAVFAMVADDFRHGFFSAFPMRQDYAGLTFTAFRALFCAVYEGVSGASDLSRSHMVFSYAVTPVLMSLGCYVLLSSLCSRAAAFLATLVCAMGFQFWTSNYGNDFYPFYFIAACLLLAWRARLENPFEQLGKKGLLLAGAVAGHLYYTTPVTLIYVLAFFLPIPWFWSEVNRLRRQKDLITRFLLTAAGAFGALFLYIDIFGRDFGHFLGHAVKLDAKPNLHLAVLLALIAWMRSRASLLSRERFVRAAIIALGALIGDLPEILFFVHRHFAPKTILNYVSYDFPTSMQVAGLVPSAFRELVAANTNGFGVNASILLFGIAMFLLFRAVIRDERYQPIAFTAALATLLYCSVGTYVQPMAPTRYLFPLFPALIASLGLVCEWLVSEKNRKTHPFLAAWLATLLVLHSGDQLWARKNLVDGIKAAHEVERIRETVQVFQNANVEVVVSDDFLHTNTYSLLGGRKPQYWSTGRRWGPPVAEELAHAEKRAGIFLSHLPGTPDLASIDLLQRSWRLKALRQVGDRALYVGFSN